MTDKPARLFRYEGRVHDELVFTAVDGGTIDFVQSGRFVACGPAMLAALKKAAAQFEFYAESHQAKQTPDGDQKAATNAALAAEMRAVIRQVEGG
jgi:hypothetical protein